MGIYLNSLGPFSFYSELCQSPYFIDKTPMLEELIPRIGTTQKYICITRPRRFGKSAAANMIAAFFSAASNSGPLFDHLKIAETASYTEHLNRHHVIFVAFNRLPRHCVNYQQYIDRIEHRLLEDLKEAYPNVSIEPEDAVWDALNVIHNTEQGIRFLFVFDEWDFIFHKDFITEKDKAAYLDFLSNLLKDQPYVELAYMTGILPIAKYSSGSELNMFTEYTMAEKIKYSSYFGFSEEEVDELFHRYQRLTNNPRITRRELCRWYDGYRTPAGIRLYNPRSVICALSDNQLSNYWTNSGPYDEIFYYVKHNIDDIRDSLALMAAGESVPAKVQEYAATSMELKTKDNIISAMVVYGFLSCENNQVSIPNKELMDQFADMMKREPSLGYVYRLAKESDRMLQATLAEDTAAMLEILEYAHNTEIPLLSYNNETELTAVVNLVYLSARDTYRIEREDKAGIGYADFMFYPENKKADCIILELKVGHTPEDAIQQIIDRKYALRFTEYTGRILAVGISYDKKTKRHSCKIKVLKGGTDNETP